MNGLRRNPSDELFPTREASTYTGTPLAFFSIQAGRITSLGLDKRPPRDSEGYPNPGKTSTCHERFSQARESRQYAGRGTRTLARTFSARSDLSLCRLRGRNPGNARRMTLVIFPIREGHTYAGIQAGQTRSLGFDQRPPSDTEGSRKPGKTSSYRVKHWESGPVVFHEIRPKAFMLGLWGKPVGRLRLYSLRRRLPSILGHCLLFSASRPVEPPRLDLLRDLPGVRMVLRSLERRSPASDYHRHDG